VLVPVRDYTTLAHLDGVVRETDTSARDIVVVTVRLLQGPDAAAATFESEDLFTNYEQRLFTGVVAVAERHGRTVKLLVVPATNIEDALALTAIRLRATEIVLGDSAKMSPADQARLSGDAWDRIPGSGERTTELVITAGGRQFRYWLGAHAPALKADDVAHIHRLWLAAMKVAGTEIHHRDIVAAALSGFEDELMGPQPDRALVRLRHQTSRP
jgi:hypothetical protein